MEIRNVKRTLIFTVAAMLAILNASAGYGQQVHPSASPSLPPLVVSDGEGIEGRIIVCPISSANIRRRPLRARHAGWRPHGFHLKRRWRNYSPFWNSGSGCVLIERRGSTSAQRNQRA